MDHLRVARSQGLWECLEITADCAREAVEETAADCVQSVSDFVAGEKRTPWITFWR